MWLWGPGRRNGCDFGNCLCESTQSNFNRISDVRTSLDNKYAGVRSLQYLPAGTQVLAISGTQDEVITSEPFGNPRGVWDSVLKDMPCRATTTVRLIEKGGHGVYPAAKGRKATTTTQLVQYIDTFVMGNNGDVPSRQSIRDADIEAYISKR